VTTAKITDENVTEAKLDIATASGAGVDGYSLQWNNTAGKMDWVALSVDLDEMVKTQSGSAGILSDSYFLETAGVIDLKDASVATAKIVDGNVTEAKLDIATASGAGVDGYVLKWDNAAGKMDWVAVATDQDEKVKTQSGSAGILSDTYFLESAGVIALKDASVTNAKLLMMR
jgi:hypothetical protein